MAEIFPLFGYKNTQCPSICQGDQTVLSIMSAHLDEFSFPAYDDSVLSSNFNGEIPTNSKVLSSEEIVRLAGSLYVGGFPNGGVGSCFVSPALRPEDQNWLELAHLLFTSAECISNKQYDQTARLLTQCRNFSSQWGNPIQRLCYYFSGALQDRIERQACAELKNPLKPPLNFANNFNSGYNKAKFNQVLAFYNSVLPYVKILQLTSVQAILDSVGNSSKIHVVDLEIRNGCHVRNINFYS